MQYSPEGQLPMMSFDSYKYFDSMAILDYLFNKYPNEKLMPSSYPNRYKVYEAMSYMNTYVYPAYTQYFTARKYYPAQADYAKVEETSRKYLYSYYDKMEKYFASNKFYAGDFFSIADVMFAVMAEWAPYAGFKYNFGPNTQKYLDSIYSMPAYKAISESEYKAASQYYKAA
jgi:glutathione S-transferase